MSRTTEISRRLCASSAILLADRQALLIWLGTIGVSDPAFTVTRVMIQMADFDMDRAIRLQWLCERSGLALDEVKASEVELVAHGVRRMDLYRLSMP